MRLGPLGSALGYALIGPMIWTGLVLAFFYRAVENLGAIELGDFWKLLFAAYIIAGPPLAACGLLVGVSAQRGARLPTLTLLSALYGTAFGLLSGFLWTSLGSVAEGSAFAIVAMIAIAIGASAFVSALVLALPSLLRRGQAN